MGGMLCTLEVTLIVDISLLELASSLRYPLHPCSWALIHIWLLSPPQSKAGGLLFFERESVLVEGTAAQ